MKKYGLLFLLMFIAANIFAQSDSLPIYKRFPTIPPFKLFIAPDSTLFRETDLKKNKAVMFFLFSPDCDHCKKAFADLVANIDLYKNIQIIMTSPLRYDILKKFYDEHHVADYPNILIGRDPSASLNVVFDNKYLPGIFLYDKKGHLKNEVREHPDFKKIADLF